MSHHLVPTSEPQGLFPISNKVLLLSLILFATSSNWQSFDKEYCRALQFCAVHILDNWILTPLENLALVIIALCMKSFFLST